MRWCQTRRGTNKCLAYHSVGTSHREPAHSFVCQATVGASNYTAANSQLCKWRKAHQAPTGADNCGYFTMRRQHVPLKT